MGGGTSLWASPDWKKHPREIFNRKLLLLGITVAFAGRSYGFDQGNTGGVLTLQSVRHAMEFDGLSEAQVSARGE